MSPASEDVVIRAAYRALMRRYHPDADPSSDAAERAQAINAAYAVLSDPERRARYDGSLAAQGLIKPEAHQTSLARRMVPGPAGLIGLTVLAAAATFMILSPPIGVPPRDGLPLSGESHPQRLPPEPTQKIQVDDNDAVAPPAAVPMTKEVPNAMLEPPEEVVAPEALRAKPVKPETPRQKPASPPMAPPRVAAKSAVVPSAKPTVVANKASSDCRLGNGWADQAICNSSNLTALDRQNGLLYAQSWSRADEVKRAALLGSRERFQEKRNACRSENCLTNTYIARLREISDIMARGSQQ